MESRRFVDWAFNHYLDIAHPRFVTAGARGAGGQGRRPADSGQRGGRDLIVTLRSANAQLPQLSVALTCTR